MISAEYLLQIVRCESAISLVENIVKIQKRSQKRIYGELQIETAVEIYIFSIAPSSSGFLHFSALGVCQKVI